MDASTEYEKIMSKRSSPFPEVEERNRKMERQAGKTPSNKEWVENTAGTRAGYLGTKKRKRALLDKLEE